MRRIQHETWRMLSCKYHPFVRLNFSSYLELLPLNLDASSKVMCQYWFVITLITLHDFTSHLHVQYYENFTFPSISPISLTMLICIFCVSYHWSKGKIHKLNWRKLSDNKFYYLWKIISFYTSVHMHDTAFICSTQTCITNRWS